MRSEHKTVIIIMAQKNISRLGQTTSFFVLLYEVNYLKSSFLKMGVATEIQGVINYLHSVIDYSLSIYAKVVFQMTA